MFFKKDLESVKNNILELKNSVQEHNDDVYSKLRDIELQLSNLVTLLNVVLGVANSGSMTARSQPSGSFVGQVVESLPEPPTALTGRRNATNRNT